MDIPYLGTMDLPLAKCPLLRTKTIHEAVEAFGRMYCPVELTGSNVGSSFRWNVNGVSLGNMRVVVGWIDNDLAASSELGPNSVIVTFARHGTGILQQSGRELLVSEQQGAVITPHRETQLLLHHDFASLTVSLDYATLTDTLYALSGTYSAKPLEFDSVFDIQSLQGAEICRLLDFILTTLEQDPSPLAHPLVLGNLQNAFLMGFLHGQPHNHHHLLEGGVATPSLRAVQMAEAYLDAHADKVVTMADLQAVTGMSVRSIQAGFKARRGCSPMEFLRERRLLMAQQRLQHATLGTKVAEVAYSCGFGHLGRFSRDYNKRFGEKPSETLDRVLRSQNGLRGPTIPAKLTGSRP